MEIAFIFYLLPIYAVFLVFQTAIKIISCLYGGFQDSLKIFLHAINFQC
jgi:hypothetical protein